MSNATQFRRDAYEQLTHKATQLDYTSVYSATVYATKTVILLPLQSKYQFPCAMLSATEAALRVSLFLAAACVLRN